MAAKHLKQRSIGKLETYEAPDKSFSKHLLTEGVGDCMANDGSTCTVYICRVGDDTESEVDPSLLGNYKLNEQCEVVIGEGDAILSEHFDKIICAMKEKETSYVKSKMDYTGKLQDEFKVGKINYGIRINVTLMELSRAADSDELELDELVERAQHHKNKGTELFQKSNVTYAIKRYEKSLNYLGYCNKSNLESFKSQAELLMCQCHFNLAACFLKIEEYKKVVEHCDEGLELDPKSVKGLFRRGQAQVKLDCYKEAKEDFSAALVLEPQNKAVKEQMKVLEGLVNKEKRMYQRMF